MGQVVLVSDQTGRRLALKLLHDLSARDPEERARLAREAEALARLQHPHVVRVHGADLEGPRPYLVQELLPGGSLQDELDREGRLSVERALEIVRKLGQGLAHAHAQGILHRDLKPANALFDEHGEPKLVDFGLAAMTGASPLTQTGTVMGTPAFMATEQAYGDRELDVRTDVYGLGALLFALLTGRGPFADGGGVAKTLLAVAEQPAPDLRKLRPDAPDWIADLCRRALAKSPDDRPQTAEAFLASLEAGPAQANPTTPARIVGAAAALAVVVGGLLALATARPAPSPAHSSPSSPSPASTAASPLPTRAEIDWESCEAALLADRPSRALDLLGEEVPADPLADRWRRLRASALLLQGTFPEVRPLWPSLGSACTQEEARRALQASVDRGPGEAGWPITAMMARVDHKREATPAWRRESEELVAGFARLRVDDDLRQVLAQRLATTVALALQACHEEVLRKDHERLSALLLDLGELGAVPEAQLARELLARQILGEAPNPPLVAGPGWTPAQRMVLAALDALEGRLPLEDATPLFLDELPALHWIPAQTVERALEGLTQQWILVSAEALWGPGSEEERMRLAGPACDTATRLARAQLDAAIRRIGPAGATTEDRHVLLAQALLLRGDAERARELLQGQRAFSTERDEARHRLLLAECALLSGNLDEAEERLYRLTMTAQNDQESYVDPHCARALLRALRGDPDGALRDLESRKVRGLSPYLPWRTLARTRRAIKGDDPRVPLAKSLAAKDD
jgi:hypothetical protein